MELPCSCNDSGKQTLQTMASLNGHSSAPLDEILKLHQNLHQLGSGVRKCLGCCTNDDVLKPLLDGLAILSTLYEAALAQYSEVSLSGETACDISVQSHPAVNPLQSRSIAPASGIGGRPNEHNSNLLHTKVSDPIPSIALGRIELTEIENNLVAVILIKQGLSQTGSLLRDLQQHLIKCLMVQKMQRGSFELYTRKVSEIMNGIYTALASM